MPLFPLQPAFEIQHWTVISLGNGYKTCKLREPLVYTCTVVLSNFFPLKLLYGMTVSRHVIRYMKQCFFNRDTWSECNEQVFMAQAHACAIESLRNIHDPADGKVRSSD